jgi:hypothetical protein
MHKTRGGVEVEVEVTVRSESTSTSTSGDGHFNDGEQVDVEGGIRRLQNHHPLPRSDVLIVQRARRHLMESKLQQMPATEIQKCETCS